MAKVIKAIRQDQLGLTQEQFANEVTRVSRGYISLIEATETARVSRSTGERIANVFGMSVEDLMPEQNSQE